MIFPGCQVGSYHIGDHFPIRYLPTDPTTLVGASPRYGVFDTSIFTIAMISLGILLSLTVVIVGALDFFERWKVYRFFAEQRHPLSSGKKAQ